MRAGHIDPEVLVSSGLAQKLFTIEEFRRMAEVGIFGPRMLEVLDEPPLDVPTSILEALEEERADPSAD